MRSYDKYYSVYINQTYMSFVKGVADFFRENWFPRTKDNIVISPYNKAVQRIQNRNKEGGEPFVVKFPYIVFDPDGEFEPDEALGRMLYSYPQFSTKLAAEQYDPPIYLDDNIRIAPVLNRYTGEFNITIHSSYTESIDNRFKVMQFFGGIGRSVSPPINSYFVLPDELELYEYSNEYTGDAYKLDWENSKSTATLIRSTNQEKYIFPFTVAPLLELTGISDGSDKYGGSGDTIGESRITISVKWSCLFPVHVIICADKLPNICCKISFDIGIGYTYLQISKQLPERMFAPLQLITICGVDCCGTEGRNVDLIYDYQICYVITEEDATNMVNKEPIFITLPTPVEHCNMLRLYNRDGLMQPDRVWTWIDSTTVRINSFAFDSTLTKDDIINIAIYKKDDEEYKVY